ncbi:MAG: hypothetical protein H7281_11970 [Bacteriovorax sp.]|nr:hypothetical protein [Bacteriovorax sp.]
MKKEILFIGLSLCATSSFAASYDTLPKGIDMLVMKQVMTSKIESKYDSNNQADSLALKENFSSNKLENISGALKTYFQELKAISPDAYNQFSLGEFSAEAYAQVSAQGLGLARGMTDHFTVYGSLPIYHIKTSVSFHQTQKSNLAAVQAAVQNAPTNTATSTFVRQLTLQLPETNEQLLQSLVVNYYGYKPLGTWEKDALGDAEIGGIYRLTDFYDKGFAIAGGVVLPTGDADDPDSLQDVSTGDGQYDVFVESMAGVSYFDNALQFDLKTRFTYQFATKKVLRTTDDPDMPLSKNKELMSEKLGNKIDSTLSVTYNTTPWLNFNSSFIFSETGASHYGASDPRVKSVLELNTMSTNQWARVGIGFSSVELYKVKKMDIPCELNLSAQKLLNAKNAANYERFDLDFRLYF